MWLYRELKSVNGCALGNVFCTNDRHEGLVIYDEGM